MVRLAPSRSQVCGAAVGLEIVGKDHRRIGRDTGIEGIPRRDPDVAGRQRRGAGHRDQHEADHHGQQERLATKSAA